MILNPDYTLKTIEDIGYIMPLGQALADRQQGLTVNEAGILMWNALLEGKEEEDLISLLYSYYEADPEDREIISADVRSFLHALTSRNILKADKSSIPGAPAYKTLSIAGLTISLNGQAEAFSDKFDLFETTPCAAADLSVNVIQGVPYNLELGNMILRNEQLQILEQEDRYVLLFPENKSIREEHLLKDGSQAVIYCASSYNDTSREELFHAIRFAFLYPAAKRGMVVLHSASILYEGKAWLFSGHSGMGKSTHTKLWNSVFSTPMINGDLNLITVENGSAVVHGIPWCGTSGICDNKSYPLGGITLINRSEKNYTSELTPAEKVLLVNQRLISPAWDKEQFDLNWNITANLIPYIMVCKLHCTKDPEAAEVMKKRIDKELQKQ